ncbi:large subunit GTPase 1 homolog [Onthophagus taurus]|uniref:large subunit GTPase 1 homolog n=1 Tax=Onthophagus taurus TaxID=166361 RepID=UPI0039BEB7CE
MGKKNKNSSNQLGRALVKSRFSNTSNKKFTSDGSMLHTTEIQDGYDWGRLNLQSVTEESSFQEFLSTAELAGTEFQAEKLNIKFVNPRSNVGLLTEEEKKRAIEEFDKNKDVVKIPRRPSWTTQMSAEELHQREKDNFLEWRRSLATLQEEKGILLTPYEKNLEFWRQLWRVVEKSDVVIQIVDARNPLLFRCEDLEKYVKEVSDKKTNLVLLNKADFLNDKQRELWAEYFDSLGVKYAFFSALQKDDLDEIKEDSDERKSDLNNDESELNIDDIKNDVNLLENEVNAIEKKLDCLLEVASSLPNVSCELNQDTNSLKNKNKVLSRSELIELFRTIHTESKVTEGITTIGLVGYPNVGKSSTINAILTEKKVSVSATPGKTKHFQTLYLTPEILLCDCPGLVMPSFVFSKADMVINGILPIDQMRDHVPPINLVSSLIPRRVIENTYSIMLPNPMEGEDQDRCPTAEEILNAYGYSRGFMTANGQPDNPRAARYILKDFLHGKLLYVHSPPGCDVSKFNDWENKNQSFIKKHLPLREQRAIIGTRVTSEDFNKQFFGGNSSGMHTKGTKLISSGATSATDLGPKPWKKINKHENKKKKEKLRRLYSHLDQH